MVSVLILTKNEEIDIGGCLESVSFSDDVHVFDSFSTDRTVEIAESMGAKVTQRVFDNYASQRNAAITGIDYRYEWLLVVDADERIPPQMREEVLAIARENRPEIAAGRCERRDYFMGRWLRRAAISTQFIRFFRPAKASYTREINEVIQIDGEVLQMKTWFDHYPFSKGMAHWVDKHNRYSTMEAEEVIKVREEGGEFRFSGIFARDFHERRFHQKQLFYRLPGRPLIKWMYMMFGRFAWLDGGPGVMFVQLQCMYERMIVIKTKEHLRRRRGESI